uniref:UPF3A regulator of nonsense mediated mRNA decay n=1 Tax=Leptobrachium leishanense TaxID=445787 RepID=A0A8C5PG12_9ANUR
MNDNIKGCYRKEKNDFFKKNGKNSLEWTFYFQDTNVYLVCFMLNAVLVFIFIYILFCSGQEYPAVVEFAPFQKISKKKLKKKDTKAGTLQFTIKIWIKSCVL